LIELKSNKNYLMVSETCWSCCRCRCRCRCRRTRWQKENLKVRAGPFYTRLRIKSFPS